eukprot:COSAG01_NODE_68722_length_263_cov_0.841463_1_plen_67_part_10
MIYLSRRMKTIGGEERPNVTCWQRKTDMPRRAPQFGFDHRVRSIAGCTTCPVFLRHHSHCTHVPVKQ